jgi:hypothetical protein
MIADIEQGRIDLEEQRRSSGEARITNEVAPTDLGVPTERVAPETLQAVDSLFPAPTSGLEFLALLLRLAIAKQMALAEMGLADVAEISVPSIRKLAALIGWSYDTTDKYVRLFCALGLLVKSRENGLVKLRFPLCRYQPPQTLSRLDQIIEQARPKVVSCAKRVKRRFLLLYGKQLPAPDTSLPELQPAASLATEIQGVIGELRQTMTLPESAPIRARLAEILAKLEQATPRESTNLPGLGEHLVDSAGQAHLQNGRLDAKMVGSLPLQGHEAKQNGRLGGKKSTSAAGASSQNGRLSEKTVDSAGQAHLQNGRLGGKTVDSDPEGSEQNGRLGAKMVGSAGETPGENGRLETEKSTVLPPESPENGRLSAETVDFSAKMVDSSTEDAPNVNVITNILYKLNVNVRESTREVVECLRTEFGEAENKRGWYYNVLKTCAEPAIWLAATIETVVAMQRQADPVRDPGRYFCSRVRAMHGAGIPPETEQLVTRYGCLSFAQLKAVLQGAGSAKAGGQAAPASKPRPKLQTKRPHDPARRGMNRGDAQSLLAALKALSETEMANGRYGYRLHCFRQEDGSHSIWASGFMDREVWFYECAGWQEQLKHIMVPGLESVGK